MARSRLDNLAHRPLLIVGFPRGMTSGVYRLVQRATGLRELFGGVGDGEIFNPGRVEHLISGMPGDDQSGFYDRSEAGYLRVAAIAAHVEAGFVIKDVVQPFHVLRYLAANPGHFEVLYVRRPLEHVAFAQARRGWAYAHSMEQLAEAFSAFPTLDMQRLLFDGGVLFDTLRDRFGYHVEPFDYLTPAFIAQRDRFYSDFAAFAGGAPETDAVPALEPGRYYGAADAGHAALAEGWRAGGSRATFDRGRLTVLRFRINAPPSAGKRLLLDIVSRGTWRVEAWIEGRPFRPDELRIDRRRTTLALPLRHHADWHAHRIWNIALAVHPAGWSQRWSFAMPAPAVSGFRIG
jgi:hypothetical protein